MRCRIYHNTRRREESFMSFRFRKFTIALLVVIQCACGPSKTQIAQITPIPAEKTVLRVCSDPNNLPFSNDKQEGFENKIAELIARDMNLKLEYTWWAQRRGFVRNTLKSDLCDLIVGMPTSSELASTTAPYYRSTYVFLWRKDRGLNIHSFD